MSAESIAERIEEDRALYARAYAAGWRDREAQAVAEGPTPALVRDSVRRMFAGWDGPEAAQVRSITRFHAARRADVQGVAA